MAEFPKLKTGTITQYPSTREEEFGTTVLSFIDGSEQSWRERRKLVHRWALRFESLDEGEIATLARFFEQQGGRAGHFSFEDPWDGTVYADCSFEQDSMEIGCAGEARFETALTIRENI
jgi:hypothetical protein